MTSRIRLPLLSGWNDYFGLMPIASSLRLASA